MGLSPLLVDNYQRYKRDTKMFTQWLGTTARATGLVEDVFLDSSDTTQPAARVSNKGKKRKPRKQSTAYQVLVNDLITLAKAVRRAEALRVPRHILTILGDVIKARKGCATWYRAHQSEESNITKSHNEGHQHIIEVLEDVYELLSPMEEEVKLQAEKTKTPDAKTQLTNLFSLLEIEEYPDLNSEEIWAPTTSKKALQVSYEPEISPEDVSFAIYCFMKDMTDIRIFIRRTWREYKHSQITINSAATTVDAALNIMRRINNTFTESFPDFVEHASLIDYLYNGYVDPNSKGINTMANEHFASYEADGIRLSSKMFFCDHTTTLLMEFFGTATLPMYQRHMMDGKGLMSDEHNLLQCLSHFNILDWRFNDHDPNKDMDEIFFDDHVLRAVRMMRVEKKFPTWAIFACQVFVDTRRELGAQLDKGFEDFKKHGVWLMGAWNDCLETGKDNGINDFHKKNDPGIRKHLHHLRVGVETDFVQELIDDTFENQPDKSDLYRWGECFLLKNHPLMCGQILQKHLVFSHLLGTRIAADQGPVRTAIHLTNAVALAVDLLMVSAWADINFIIKKHGDAHLFVGERPKKLFNCFRRMCLAFGLGASQFSMNKNKKADSRDLKMQRDPQSIQKLHRRLHPMSRYAHSSQALNDGVLKPTRAAADSFVMMELLVNRLLNSKDISCPANPNNEKGYQKNHFMTPLQSLKIFKQALKEDDLPLRFDLISMNWRCVLLLRRIQKICLEKSPLDYPVEKWGGDDGINSIICHMFAAVAGIEHKQPSRFREACIEVLDIIDREGNVEYMKANARRGIIQGTAVDPKEDPEDFEDPDQNFVLPKCRKNIPHMSANELARLKSRGQDSMPYLRG
jgi:hypothetical protein